jgi:hypothetical protein
MTYGNAAKTQRFILDVVLAQTVLVQWVIDDFAFWTGILCNSRV